MRMRDSIECVLYGVCADTAKLTTMDFAKWDWCAICGDLNMCLIELGRQGWLGGLEVCHTVKVSAIGWRQTHWLTHNGCFALVD